MITTSSEQLPLEYLHGRIRYQRDRSADLLHIQAEHAALVTALCRCLRTSVRLGLEDSLEQFGIGWLPEELCDLSQLGFRADVLDSIAFAQNGLVHAEFRRCAAEDER
ncbi:MAG: hypothetical protein M1826_004597 [Phylliscum demangeonii]|nr:MAG: hypothetical protein M1826_004597 [Phylliscum demangeonii]